MANHEKHTTGLDMDCTSTKTYVDMAIDCNKHI
jgi:hypothetical protein